MTTLIDQLRQATEPTRELDALIWWHCVGKADGWEYDGQVRKSYTTSTDAALTLIPDGWTRVIDNTGGVEIVELYPPDDDRFRIVRGVSAHLAIAVCIAALEAMRDEINRRT